MLSRYYAVLIIARGSPRANRNAHRVHIVIECILRDTRRNGLNVFARNVFGEEGQDRVVGIGCEERVRWGGVKLFFSAITSSRQWRGKERQRDRNARLARSRREEEVLVGKVACTVRGGIS